MTEAISLELKLEQNVKLTEDSCWNVRPELKTQTVESNSSHVDPDKKAQISDFGNADASPETKSLWTNSSNFDMNTNQKAQLAEANNSCRSIAQKTLLTEERNYGKTTDLIGELLYRCKKCRRIVAAEGSLISHKQGTGEGFRGRRKSDEANTPECTALFVEPLKWMEPVQEGYLGEKLYCAGCKTKLGCFNWAGMQCSCGAWVTPAFQILKSRVDECHV